MNVPGVRLWVALNVGGIAVNGAHIAVFGRLFRRILVVAGFGNWMCVWWDPTMLRLHTTFILIMPKMSELTFSTGWYDVRGEEAVCELILLD